MVFKIRFGIFAKKNYGLKILVIRFSSIGDLILTTPILRVLRQNFPDAHIDLLTKKQFVDLFRFNPNIDQIHEFDSKTGFSGLKKLKKNLPAYDWVVDLHQNLRSNFLRIGKKNTSYTKPIFKRWLLVKLKLNLYKNSTPTFLRYFDAIKPYSYDNLGTEVFVNEEISEKITKQISEKNLQKYVVLCPAAQWQTKRWLPENFAKLAQKFLEKGFQVLLLGGKEDATLCEKVREMSSPEVHNLAGTCSLLESAQWLKNAGLAVVNDTGLMHLAQSQKTAVVAIFGSTTQELGFFPLPQKSAVVEVELNCRPCTDKGRTSCPKKHFDCMQKITVEMVWQKCLLFI